VSVDEATISRIAIEIAKAQARSDTPRYRQIVDVLLATIERGLLAPGDRLPPETKLAPLFSVSLGTVQKALTHLASNGILQRVRRKGTIVVGRQAEDVFVFRFKEPGTGKILIPFTRVLSITDDGTDGPWRRFLGGKRHVRVDRLVWVEGEAPAFSQVRIALEHGRALLKMPIDSLHGLSFHKVLGRKFNLPTVRTSHRLQCQRLSRTACRHLSVPAGTYGMIWDVVGFSHRQATTYQSLQMPAGHRPIELEIPTTGTRPETGIDPSADGEGAWR
jgi:DNA-binding GntR family transcriptional regulator